MAGPGGKVEVEQNLLNNKIKTVTAYFGDELIEWGKMQNGTVDDLFSEENLNYQRDCESDF